MSGRDTISRRNGTTSSNQNSEKPPTTEVDSTNVNEATLLQTPTLLSTYTASSKLGGIGSFFRARSGTGSIVNTPTEEGFSSGGEGGEGPENQRRTPLGILPAEGIRVGLPLTIHSTLPLSTDPRRNSRPTNLILPPFLRRDRSSSTIAANTTPSNSSTSPTSPISSTSTSLPASPRNRSRSSIEPAGWSSRSISSGMNNSTRPPVSPTSYSTASSTRFRAGSSTELLPKSPSNPQSLHSQSTSRLTTTSTTTTTTSVRPSEERTDSGGSTSTSGSSSSSNRGSSSSGTLNSSSNSSNNSSSGGYGFFKRDSRGSPRRNIDESDEVEREKRRDRSSSSLVTRNEDLQVQEQQEDETEQEVDSIERIGKLKGPIKPDQDIPVSRTISPSSPPQNASSSIKPISSNSLATTSSLQQRRATLNIDNLHLYGFDSSPTTSPPTIVAPLPVANFSSISGLPVESAASSSSAITTTTTTSSNGLRNLPRLLSYSTVYVKTESNSSSPGSEGSETGGETENDNEGGTETEEGESETDADGSDEILTPPVPLANLPTTVVIPAGASPFFDAPFNLASRNSQLRPSPPLRSHSAASLTRPNGVSWVTFDPLTPTPLRTARPVAESNTLQSYFDLPTRNSLSRTSGPLMSPLVPMSQSSVARGKRPVREDEASVPSSTTESQEVEVQAGASFYRRRSQSVVGLLSPNNLGDEGEEVGTAALGELDPVWQTDGMKTPGPAFLSPLLSPTTTTTSPILRSPPSMSIIKLNRPRSMYELHVAPPAYHAVYKRAGLGPAQIVFPREEEGKEGLPDYSCAVHLEAYMPRKMEFIGPNIQAKSRGWSKQYVVLHGTSIKIYKYDLRTHPVEGLPNFEYTSADLHPTDGPELLHVHPGEYRSSGSSPPSTTSTLSKLPIVSVVKSKAHLPTSNPSANVLLRDYSLQNAESGLAADYVKRKHVVRVRAAGEQFLLQAKDDRGVIDLIEALQAATNTALDLDVRPIPKFITLPRRRRRRRAGPAIVNGVYVNPAPSQSTVVESANREDEGRLSEMLEEEQHSYSSATNASEV